MFLLLQDGDDGYDDDDAGPADMSYIDMASQQPADTSCLTGDNLIAPPNKVSSHSRSS